MAQHKPLILSQGTVRELPDGDSLNGLVNSDDQRLSDAREWTASVVPQAEAEAGTSSTARKWTAQRVRQAINAWWQIVASGFGRNFVQASNAAAARNSLELGTAATANVTTSSTDTIAGRVMKVGDFGVGVALAPNMPSAPLLVNGTFTGITTTNGYANAPFGNIGYIYTQARQTGYLSQFALSLNGSRLAFRSFPEASAETVPWAEVAFLGSPAFTGTPSVPNLKFGNVASADINTLDYYEEGTWTPILYGKTTAGTNTYHSENGGSYTRIGNVVYYTAIIRLTTTLGMAGQVALAGLPYINKVGQLNRGGVVVGGFDGVVAGYTGYISGVHNSAAASIDLLNGRVGVFDAANVTATFRLFISGFYFTN
ncbi:Uncharacterised protein [uncultured Comamonas sp.]|nr:Uncharacterised protein [uncultured Comamonas sp.]